ncbi:MAG: FtsB family cell division protein [Actinomycetota bacterium]
MTVRSEAAPRPRLTGRAALLLIVLTVLAVFSTVPVREYLSQRSLIAELERQARTLEQENAGLRTDMAKLYDPAELERLARECLGMVAPGEIAFVTASRAREAELSDC